MPLAASTPYPQAIAAGVAALDGEQADFRLAVPPTLHNLKLLNRQDISTRNDVVLLPRGVFNGMVRALHAGTIARAAADDERKAPSARKGMSLSQPSRLLTALMRILIGLVLAPAGTLIALAVLATPLFMTLGLSQMQRRAGGLAQSQRIGTD